MKFRVSMKDPDTLHDSIEEAVKAEVAEELQDEDEREVLAEMRVSNALKLCGRWFKYSEYLTVEIDTDAETCVVVPERA